MKRLVLTAAVLALVFAGCATTSLRTVECPSDREDWCERKAENECGTKKYVVTQKRAPAGYKAKREIDKTTATTVNEATGQGVSGGTVDPAADRWRWTVDCNPPPNARMEVTVERTIKRGPTAEELAYAERVKQQFIREVCELTDPENRREQLEIARRDYGPDVSC